MEEPTGSEETIMRHAMSSARSYLFQAIDDVDKIFGKGAATSHPELVAAYINAAALEYQGASIMAGLYRIAAAGWQIANELDDLNDAGSSIAYELGKIGDAES